MRRQSGMNEAMKIRLNSHKNHACLNGLTEQSAEKPTEFNHTAAFRSLERDSLSRSASSADTKFQVFPHRNNRVKRRAAGRRPALRVVRSLAVFLTLAFSTLLPRANAATL